MLVRFTLGFFIGMALALSVVKFGRAEVNIAEVSGKYQQRTIKDAVQMRHINAARLGQAALEQAYLAGYGQALMDYNILSSSAPATVKGEEEKEEGN